MSQRSKGDYKECMKDLFEPEKKLLSKNQQKRLNYKALINGYIRKQIAHTKTIQQSIIQLFISYCTILDIPAQENPLNFISNQDIEKCNHYKSEGNQYYKLKQYNEAIVKYTTALRFNPNNHLVLNNRALCYYMTKNYKDAEQDAKESIQKSPTFFKAWYRYGTIFEKRGNYRFAGICYRTAYCLSIDWEIQKPKQKTNAFKKRYDAYMKKLDKTGQSDIMDWINSFDQNVGEFNEEKMVEDMLSKMGTNDDMKEMMNSPDGMQNMLRHLMENETFVGNQEKEILHSLVEESKYIHLLKTNGFNDSNDSWSISWSSTPQIMDNKRMFNVTVSSDAQRKIIGQYTHFGVPKADDYIQYLYRTMSFCNLTKIRRTKPRALVIDWRSRLVFDEMQRAMRKIGIDCIQETYEDSLSVCKANDTDVNGWNHLDWAE